MTYWMSFYAPAYGMHWGFVKPYPCTHGCVRLPIKTARKMFDMVPSARQSMSPPAILRTPTIGSHPAAAG
jgi:hypothetical protein